MDKATQFKEHLTAEFKKFNSMMSYEELKSAIQTLINFVKNQKEMTAQELEAIKVMLKSATAKMASDQSVEMKNGKKEMMAYCESEMNKMLFTHEAMMSAMDKKMDTVKDGKDADEAIVAEKASKLTLQAIKADLLTISQVNDNLAKQGDLIADAVSGKLLIEDIKNLREELDELRKLKTQRLGGGGGMSLLSLQQHIIPWTETSVAPNGVLTDFVIAYTPNPTNSLEVMVDNSPLFETSDWTYDTSTKTISFLVAPPNGSTIRYKALI